MKNFDVVVFMEQTAAVMKQLANYKKEELKVAFAKLEGLKSALRAANIFHEASIAYAKMEAIALIRAVELNDGEEPELTGRNKTLRAEAAVWLYNMNEKERNAVIQKCNHGKTIVAVYTEETSPSREEQVHRLKMRIKDRVMNDLRETGTCTISDEEINRWVKRFPSNLREEIKEYTRHLLRSVGAVGIDDKKGTYILPESNNDLVYEALDNRIQSISRDFASFLKIAAKCKFKPQYHFHKVGRENIVGPDYILLLAAYFNAVDITATDVAAQEMKKVLREAMQLLSEPIPTMKGTKDYETINRWFMEDTENIIKTYKPHKDHMVELYDKICNAKEEYNKKTKEKADEIFEKYNQDN